MKTKIENQEQYDARIKYFKEKYIKDFEEKVNVPEYIRAYVKERFKRDVLEVRLHEILNLKSVNEADQFRNQKEWLKGIKAFEAIKGFCEEKNLKKVTQNILQSLAEYDAILNVHLELKYQNPIKNNEGQDQIRLLQSTIEDKLYTCKGAFNIESDFFEAIKYLQSFFLSENIAINQPLFVKSGNIKSLALALGEIWRSRKNEPISYEYLCLYKQLFSIFKNQKIDKRNIFSCNLYKYSISKT